MRFEIRTGGAFVIFIGLVALSGAVFALGLVAGHEMFRQNQPDLSQISTTYPMPSAPVGGATPASVASPMNLGTPAIAAAAPSTSSSAIKPPAAARPSVAALARVKPPAPAINPPPPAEDEETSDEPPPAAAAVPTAGSKPYNIQIEAVMDKSGADEMVSRLKTLGYNAQEIKTALNGQTWYRVRVGPYNSQEEAKAAQDKLREQYKQAYTTSH
jgi:cell division septation protein DedD